MIEHANKGQIEGISKITLDLLKGNMLIPTPSNIQEPSFRRKAQVTNQKGGFLPTLASLFASLAINLFGKVSK